MPATLKILSPVLLVSLLGAGCSMNDRSTVLPMDYVRNDWNDNVPMSSTAQQSAYQANQNLVSSGIVFHDYVQKDMGLSPAGVWYPTYDMAEGKVSTGDADKPMTAQPDPAKVDSSVHYDATPMHTTPAAKPMPMTTPPPQAGEGEIDYNMLQRSIKQQ